MISFSRHQMILQTRFLSGCCPYIFPYHGFFFQCLLLSLVAFLCLRVFEKSMQYVKRFSRYKNPDSVRQAREYPLFCRYLWTKRSWFFFWNNQQQLDIKFEFVYVRSTCLFAAYLEFEILNRLLRVLSRYKLAEFEVRTKLL